MIVHIDPPLGELRSILLTKTALFQSLASQLLAPEYSIVDKEPRPLCEDVQNLMGLTPKFQFPVSRRWHSELSSLDTAQMSGFEVLSKLGQGSGDHRLEFDKIVWTSEIQHLISQNRLSKYHDFLAAAVEPEPAYLKMT